MATPIQDATMTRCPHCGQKHNMSEDPFHQEKLRQIMVNAGQAQMLIAELLGMELGLVYKKTLDTARQTDAKYILLVCGALEQVASELAMHQQVAKALPKTRDHFLIAPVSNAQVWHPNHGHPSALVYHHAERGWLAQFEEIGTGPGYSTEEREYPVSECYGDEAAARAQ